jgi:hypothetical protein
MVSKIIFETYYSRRLKNMKMDRRDFLKLSYGSVVTASLLGGGASFTYAKETNYKAYIE